MLDGRRVSLVALTAVLVGAVLTTGAAASDAPPAGQPTRPASEVQNRADKGLEAVAAVAPDDVWEVGIVNDVDPLLRHWDGNHWRPFQAPRGVKGLYAADGLSSTDVWVGGQGGIIHWDGSAWTVSYDAPGHDEVMGLVAISQDDVWAVVYDDIGGGSSKVHWDGSTWTQVGKVEPDIVLSYLDADRADDVWALSTSGVVERWDGQSWQRMFDDPRYASLAVVSPDDVWIAGQVHQEAAAMWHWDGQRVARADVRTPGKYSFLVGLTVVSPSVVWAVGGKTVGRRGIRPLIEQWDGRHWHQRPTPDPMHDSYLVDVGATTANEAYAIGYLEEHRFADSMLNLRWDGTAWTQMP